MRDPLPSMPLRHHIPLFFAGKALSHGENSQRVASQTDLAATLLGLDHSGFRFSRYLLDVDSPESAWIAEPDIVGIINEKCCLI